MMKGRPSLTYGFPPAPAADHDTIIELFDPMLYTLHSRMLVEATSAGESNEIKSRELT
jgi:hypothetical protein